MTDEWTHNKRSFRSSVRRSAVPGRDPGDPYAGDEQQILAALQTAEVTDCQLVPWGSNYTFAMTLKPADAPSLVGIYKPRRGEAPLWDFPSGTLYRREYTCYVLSTLLGWRFIPPTVIRGGPHGVGTVQLYVEPGESLDDRVGRRTYADQLRQVALFDVITNNADRKGGHCFIGLHDGRLWGIDHGLTFHVHPKLRTVIWDFCGEPVPEGLLGPLREMRRCRDQVRQSLAPHLATEEIDMLFVRIQQVLDHPVFPTLNARRNIPYGW